MRLFNSKRAALIAGIASLFLIGATVAPQPKSAAADDDGAICIPVNFKGCCSWNEGVKDAKLGLCGNGATSERCAERWNPDLRGRCSWNLGVARVDTDGVVYCNNDRAPGNPIPRCAGNQ